MNISIFMRLLLLCDIIDMEREIKSYGVKTALV